MLDVRSFFIIFPPPPRRPLQLLARRQCSRQRQPAQHQGPVRPRVRLRQVHHGQHNAKHHHEHGDLPAHGPERMSRFVGRDHADHGEHGHEPAQPLLRQDQGCDDGDDRGNLRGHGHRAAVCRLIAMSLDTQQGSARQEYENTGDPEHPVPLGKNKGDEAAEQGVRQRAAHDGPHDGEPGVHVQPANQVKEQQQECHSEHVGCVDRPSHRKERNREGKRERQQQGLRLGLTHVGHQGRLGGNHQQQHHVPMVDVQVHSTS